MNVHDLATHGWPCPTAEEMRRADRHAIESVGLPSRLLMENAGRAVAAAVLSRFPKARRPLVLCGSGNNGGDGFVVARVFHEWDDRIRPLVRVFGDRARMSEETRTNLAVLVRTGTEVTFGGGKADMESLVAQADVIVDAIFGVGLTRPVTGELAEMFRAISELSVPIVALDLPSGISAESGSSLGEALRSDLIVTLGLPKLGLAVRPPGCPVLVADIGLPEESVVDAAIAQHVLTPAAVRRLLPTRTETGHKGTFGHVLIVAGSVGKTGAACLACEGALRGGAGLVTAAIPAELNPILEEKLTEVMTLPAPGGAALGEEALPLLLEEASRRDALVLGPGLGTRQETRRLVEGLLGGVHAPTVVDADGLNAFVGRPAALRGEGARVLTPHPGEASRLLGIPTQEIQEDRVGAARALARQTGAIVLLKGARSIVAAPDGRVRINPTGGPGLGTGGTGDVLAGLVGALLAQGCLPFDAAAAAAYLHGLAGDRLGPVGITASEVAATLPGAWSRVEREEQPSGPGTLHPFP